MHNTYSLKAILQSDLDPTLCKLMLHQIKSPLLEHSFQLTADDEQNNGSFSMPTYSQHSRSRPTVERGPEVKYRNREVQKQKQFDLMHQRLNQMSLVVSENQSFKPDFNYPTNRTYDQQPKHKYKDKQPSRKQQSMAQTTSLVSPLQYNPNMKATPTEDYHKNGQGQPNNNMFLLENPSTFSRHSSENQNPNDDDGVAKWCGEVFDTENAYVNQLIFDYSPKPYRRRNIFKKKQQLPLIEKASASRHRLPQPNPQYVTFSQAITRIKQIDQPQVGHFLQFLQKILALFTKLIPHRSKLIKNQHILNKMLLRYNPIDHETRQTISNKNRISNRLKVNKISDALARIFQLAQPVGNQRESGQNRDGVVEEDLGKILQYYSEIEDVIEDYVGKREIVSELNTIYNLLYEYEISRINVLSSSRTSGNKKQPQSVPIATESLKQKLHKFLACLQIDPSSYSHLHELAYIWSELNDQASYLPTNEYNYKMSREKFINQLCRNDIIVHEAVRNIHEFNIEMKLKEMGFERNIE